MTQKRYFFCTRVESAPTQLGGGVMDLINQTINHRNSKISKVIFSMVRPSTPPPLLTLIVHDTLKTVILGHGLKWITNIWNKPGTRGKASKSIMQTDDWVSESVSGPRVDVHISFLCIWSLKYSMLYFCSYNYLTYFRFTTTSNWNLFCYFCNNFLMYILCTWGFYENHIRF